MGSIINKMTTKSILGGAPNKVEIEHSDGSPIWLMTVFGRAAQRMPGESQHGPYVKFKGSFKSINHETGEEKRSRLLILPGVAEGIIDEILVQDDIETVEFAVQIGVQKSDTPIGYEWVVEPLTEMDTDSDPLAALESKLKQQELLPQLDEDPE